MLKKKKNILYVVLAIIILSLIFYGFHSFFKEEESSPGYVTQSVKKEDLEKTVLASGTLRASTMVTVGAQVSGQIEHLYVSVGDKVTEGDVIAQIDPKPKENALRNAQAALTNILAQYDAKKANLKQAELSFARQKQLRALDASSKEDFENAEADLAVLKAEIVALEAQIDQAMITVDNAELDLDYTLIKAPLSGTVVSVPVKEGQTVNANQTTPTIVKVAQLEKMTVEAKISEADIIHVKSGQNVSFTVLGAPERPFETVLKSIEPAPKAIDTTDDISSDSDAIYYIGIFDIENTENDLRIGMTTEVTIILESVKNSLVVSSSALHRSDDGRFYVNVLVGPEKIEQRFVEVGLDTNIKAEIISGLKEGDQVVIGEKTLISDATSSRRRPGGIF